MKVDVSLVASSIRPHLWKQFMESLLPNSITCEVIFVGNVRPDFDLPPQLKFIYSPVKPAQCYEIGFRKAVGKLVHWTADDATYPPGAWDAMWQFWHSFNSEKIVTEFITIENNSDCTDYHHFFGGRHDTPVMAPFGVMSLKLLRELGGYDRRFICGQAENDLVMRVYEIGGRVEISPIPVFVDHTLHANISNFRVRNGNEEGGSYPDDREFLESAWVLPDGTISPKRLLPFQGFDDENIETVTQGPTKSYFSN